MDGGRHAGLEDSLRIVDADLLGYPTHGLAFLPAYLDRLEKDKIARSGTWQVVSDRPGAFAWKCERNARRR